MKEINFRYGREENTEMITDHNIDLTIFKVKLYILVNNEELSLMLIKVIGNRYLLA